MSHYVCIAARRPTAEGCPGGNADHCGLRPISRRSFHRRHHRPVARRRPGDREAADPPCPAGGSKRYHRSCRLSGDATNPRKYRPVARAQSHRADASLSLILLANAAAIADDPLTIRVYNDESDDIVVSVYDMNAQPQQAVIANQRINGFAWIPISVTAGAVRKGHLKWIARTADPGFHRCGYQEMRGVSNDALVYVSVNSSRRRVTR